MKINGDSKRNAIPHRLPQRNRFVPYGTHPNSVLYALSEGNGCREVNLTRLDYESKLSA